MWAIQIVLILMHSPTDTHTHTKNRSTTITAEYANASILCMLSAEKMSIAIVPKNQANWIDAYFSMHFALDFTYINDSITIMIVMILTLHFRGRNSQTMPLRALDDAISNTKHEKHVLYFTNLQFENEIFTFSIDDYYHFANVYETSYHSKDSGHKSTTVFSTCFRFFSQCIDII